MRGNAAEGRADDRRRRKPGHVPSGCEFEVDVGRFEPHQRASNGYTSAKSTRPYASNGTHLWGRSTRVPTLTCHNFFSCGKVANLMVMHQPFAENKYDLPRLKLPMVSWTYYIEHII